MHKGVILLTKADSKEDAISNVNSFLEQYGDGRVWDWYQIGGRWSNTLAPKKLLKKWQKKADSVLVRENGMLYTSEIKNKADILQSMWEELGLEGKNPHFDHYSLGTEGGGYDAVSLGSCIDTVKEWIIDLGEKAEEYYKLMTKEKRKENILKKKGEPSPTMSGYYAELYKDSLYGNFSFDSNVYNIDDYEAERLPDNINGWWAVMVDMHN